MMGESGGIGEMRGERREEVGEGDGRRQRRGTRIRRRRGERKGESVCSGQ
jgi:hypothetical protein